MSILAIVVEILKSLKKMLIKIFSVSMVMHILQVNRNVHMGYRGNLVMMKKYFSDENAIKKFPKLFYAKNVHMFKNI